MQPPISGDQLLEDTWEGLGRKEISEIADE
jgi:hypothetical protein